MPKKNRLLALIGIVVVGACQTTEVKELNEYKNDASERCSGKSYENTLGKSYSADLQASVNLPKTLLSMGDVEGSGKMEFSAQEKTELAKLLENLSADKLEAFLSGYSECMEAEMDDYFRVKEGQSSEKQKSGLANGDECDVDKQCISGKCQIGPDDAYYCKHVNMQCAIEGKDGIKHKDIIELNGTRYRCESSGHDRLSKWVELTEE